MTTNQYGNSTAYDWEVSALREAASLATSEGDHHRAAEIWNKIRLSDVTIEENYAGEVSALWRCSEWEKSNHVAQLAVDAFPSSLSAYSIYARNAFLSLDWSEAVSRLKRMQEKFPPSQFPTVGAYLDQIHCFEAMFDLKAAQDLMHTHWDEIQRFHKEWHVEFSFVGTIIGRELAEQFVDWSSQRTPEPYRTFYRRRNRQAISNRDWVSKNAAKVKLISLGQICLPYILPNRWGLRINIVGEEYTLPFDYMSAPRDTTADVIRTGFADLMNPDYLKPSLYPDKSPCVINSKYAFGFYHERGPWWQANGGVRFKEVMSRRIANFFNQAYDGARVFIFCVCGPAEVKLLMDVMADFLESKDTRLIILNVQKEDIDIGFTHPRVLYAYVPYPEDYNWNAWFDFDSERGHLFEENIAEIILQSIRELARS
jgi:Putative papain-like cysteine peptidase (DUF1796)